MAITIGSKIKLHSTVGGSDKVYELWIEKSISGLFNVIYANGRRKSGATAGHKPKNPNPFHSLLGAQQFLSAAKNGKLNEGYHNIGQCNLCAGLSPGPVVVPSYPHLNLPPPEVVPIDYSKPKKTTKQHHPVVPLSPQHKVAEAPKPRTIAFNDDEDL